MSKEETLRIAQSIWDEKYEAERQYINAPPLHTFMYTFLKEKQAGINANHADIVEQAYNLHSALYTHSSDPELALLKHVLDGKLPESTHADFKTLLTLLRQSFATLEVHGEAGWVLSSSADAVLRRMFQKKDKQLVERIVNAMEMEQSTSIVHYPSLLQENGQAKTELVHELQRQHTEDVLMYLESVQRAVDNARIDSNNEYAPLGTIRARLLAVDRGKTDIEVDELVARGAALPSVASVQPLSDVSQPPECDTEAFVRRLLRGCLRPSWAYDAEAVYSGFEMQQSGEPSALIGQPELA